ncbi:EF-Tu/IF-2/RF-3 family GTPase [Bacteroidota bacterium]
MAEEIGVVTHFFSHISVGIIEITKGKLRIGDEIHIKGATSDFTQSISSMQMEHKRIEEAKKGDSIGLKVKEHVRKHDKVFKVE